MSLDQIFPLLILAVSIYLAREKTATKKEENIVEQEIKKDDSLANRDKIFNDLVVDLKYGYEEAKLKTKELEDSLNDTKKLLISQQSEIKSLEKRIQDLEHDNNIKDKTITDLTQIIDGLKKMLETKEKIIADLQLIINGTQK